MVNRNSLRLAATLLFAGEILFIVVGLFHPDREPPNNHVAVFAEYAQSGLWTTVHLGQFLTMAVVLFGMLALVVATDVQSGVPGWLMRFGAVSVVVTLGLTGVLQAVDGVALKQSVDAWASAPAAEQTVRFASAEAVRWLEWGVRSYQRITLGLSQVLFATTIIWTARLPRPIGYLMALSGVTYLVQGVVVGAEGFSANGRVPVLVTFAVDLLWIMWLGLVAWRMKESTVATRVTRPDSAATGWSTDSRRSRQGMTPSR